MKTMKQFMLGAFWILIIALLLAPLLLITEISRKEMQEFATPSVPVLQELSIGGIYQSQAESTSERITVSGTFVSAEDGYMELDYETVKDARWFVSTGEEIQTGMVIGTAGGQDILAAMDGIVSQMHISADDCYIRLELFSPVVLKARVDSRTLSILKQSGNLSCDDGKTKVTLAFSSRQQNSDGTTDVLIAIDSDQYTYGQVVSSLYISTGRFFDNVVRVPLQCVYQKNGGSQWYMRQVTADGVFLQEREVDLVYKDDDNAFVTGIEGDLYFDSGYQVIAGG